MIIRLLYILFFTCVVNVGFSQKSFEKSTLESFVEVYMSYKTLKKTDIQAPIRLFQQFGVTHKRYHEISKAMLESDILQLNSNEKELLEALKKENELLNQKNQKIVQNICLKHNLDIIDYEAILNQYNQNIQFQRSLKPYFAAYIKRSR